MMHLPEKKERAKSSCKKTTKISNKENRYVLPFFTYLLSSQLKIKAKDEIIKILITTTDEIF